MLDLAAFSIVFLIVTLAVPYTAAGIVGGTVGLALSHAFEAAYIAQTVVRPIASTLQNGFSKISRTTTGGSKDSDGGNFAAPMDFARKTQQLSNLGSSNTNGAPVPAGVRNTSSMSSRAQNTTPMNGPKTQNDSMPARHGAT
jgi:hypothetical protein